MCPTGCVPGGIRPPNLFRSALRLPRPGDRFLLLARARLPLPGGLTGGIATLCLTLCLTLSLRLSLSLSLRLFLSLTLTLRLFLSLTLPLSLPLSGCRPRLTALAGTATGLAAGLALGVAARRLLRGLLFLLATAIVEDPLHGLAVVRAIGGHAVRSRLPTCGLTTLRPLAVLRSLALLPGGRVTGGPLGPPVVAGAGLVRPRGPLVGSSLLTVTAVAGIAVAPGGLTVSRLLPLL